MKNLRFQVGGHFVVFLSVLGAAGMARGEEPAISDAAVQEASSGEFTISASRKDHPRWKELDAAVKACGSASDPKACYSKEVAKVTRPAMEALNARGETLPTVAARVVQEHCQSQRAGGSFTVRDPSIDWNSCYDGAISKARQEVSALLASADMDDAKSFREKILNAPPEKQEWALGFVQGVDGERLLKDCQGKVNGDDALFNCFTKSLELAEQDLAEAQRQNTLYLDRIRQVKILESLCTKAKGAKCGIDDPTKYTYFKKGPDGNLLTKTIDGMAVPVVTKQSKYRNGKLLTMAEASKSLGAGGGDGKGSGLGGITRKRVAGTKDGIKGGTATRPQGDGSPTGADQKEWNLRRKADADDLKNANLENACKTPEQLKSKQCSKFGFGKRGVHCEGFTCTEQRAAETVKGEKYECFGFLKETAAACAAAAGAKDKAAGGPLGASGAQLADIVSGASQKPALDEFGAFVLRANARDLFRAKAFLDPELVTGSDPKRFIKNTTFLTPKCLSPKERENLQIGLDIERIRMKGDLAKQQDKSPTRAAMQDYLMLAKEYRALETGSLEVEELYDDLCDKPDSAGDIMLSGPHWEAIADKIKQLGGYVYDGKPGTLLRGQKVSCRDLQSLPRAARERASQIMTEHPVLATVSNKSETVKVNQCITKLKDESWFFQKGCERPRTLADRLYAETPGHQPERVEKMIQKAMELKIDEVMGAVEKTCKGSDGAGEFGFASLGLEGRLKEFLGCGDVGQGSSECLERMNLAGGLCEAHKRFQRDVKHGEVSDSAKLVGMGIADVGSIALAATGWGAPVGAALGGFAGRLAIGTMAASTLASVPMAIADKARADQALIQAKANYVGGTLTHADFQKAVDDDSGFFNEYMLLTQAANIATLGFDLPEVSRMVKAYKMAMKAGRPKDFRVFMRNWAKSEKAVHYFDEASKLAKKNAKKGTMFSRSIHMAEATRKATEKGDKLALEAIDDAMGLFREEAAQKFGKEALSHSNEDVLALLDFDETLRTRKLPPVEEARLRDEAVKINRDCYKKMAASSWIPLGP